MNKFIVVVAILFCLQTVYAGSTFDLGWTYGDLAYKKCRKQETKDMKGMCSKLQDLVEDMFDTDSQTLHAAFPEVSWTEVARVAAQPSFRKAGQSMIEGIVSWMLESKTKDLTKVRAEAFQRFFKWLVEVMKEVDEPGSGNPMPMTLPEGIPMPPSRPEL